MSGEQMMAVMKEDFGEGFAYRSAPVPRPGLGDVLIKIHRAVICGTDLVLYKGGAAAETLVDKLPFIPGHECCGEVVELGDGVEGVDVGARVCAETHIPCGGCYQCTHGQEHICQHLVLFGHQVNGCFAEYATISAGCAYRLRSNIPDEVAAVLEPLGVSLRGVEAVEPRGDTLLVSGCGPIGLFATAIARHFGAGRIIAADVNSFRLGIAGAMGANVVVNVSEADLRDVVGAETDGTGVGCIIEAWGAPESVENCFSYLRKGGRMVLLGNPKKAVTIHNVMPDLMHKELTLRTIHGRRMYETWETAEGMLAAGELDVTPAITHTFGMSQVDEAVGVILGGTACKVELDPQA